MSISRTTIPFPPQQTLSHRSNAMALITSGRYLWSCVHLIVSRRVGRGLIGLFGVRGSLSFDAFIYIEIN